jgi:hypothetical protein
VLHPIPSTAPQHPPTPPRTWLPRKRGHEETPGDDDREIKYGEHPNPTLDFKKDKSRTPAWL